MHILFCFQSLRPQIARVRGGVCGICCMLPAQKAILPIEGRMADKKHVSLGGDNQHPSLDRVDLAQREKLPVASVGLAPPPSRILIPRMFLRCRDLKRFSAALPPYRACRRGIRGGRRSGMLPRVMQGTNGRLQSYCPRNTR